MQETFNANGFFSIQITPLDANLCLLEDKVEGALPEMLRNDDVWVSRQFKEVRQ